MSDGTPNNLPEAMEKQLQRNRILLEVYKSIPTGGFGATMIDREQRLQRLAAENAHWADEQLRLIETIRENKRQLERLPEIIERLNMQFEHAAEEMSRTGAEHDALEDDAKLIAWADDMADDCPAVCNGCVATLDRSEDCPLETADREAEQDWAEVEDAEFRARADDMADDYADHKLAVQPPVGW